MTSFYGFQPSSVVLYMQNSDFRTRLTSLYGSQTSSVVLSTHNSVLSTRIIRLYWFQTSPVILCMQNGDFSIWIASLYWSQPSSFCMQNIEFSTRIKNLYGSQTSPVILFLQNSVNSIRITSLYGSQPLSVAFACKTVTFGAELQISMFSRHDLSFCACTRACLASELLVSMGPNPHLWFLDAKQHLLDQNYKFLWVPDLTYRFVHANLRD